MEPAIRVATAGGLLELGSDHGPDFEGREVNTLAQGAGGWWAIVDGREVWRSQQATGWERMATSATVRLNCILPTPDGVLLGTAEAHLLRLEDGELRRIEGFDEVAGRGDWYTPWGGPSDVRSMSRAPDGTLYANVHVGGIVRSEDGGQTWSPTIDIHADVHQVRAPGLDVVLAATARGLALSGDAGQTWGFDREGLHAPYARAVGLADDTILLTASRGPSGGQAAVYRRLIDAEMGFQKCENGLPEWFSKNVDTGCLATSGAHAAFGTDGGQVYVSDDAGQSWRRVADGLPPARAVRFV